MGRGSWRGWKIAKHELRAGLEGGWGARDYAGRRGNAERMERRPCGQRDVSNGENGEALSCLVLSIHSQHARMEWRSETLVDGGAEGVLLTHSSTTVRHTYM